MKLIIQKFLFAIFLISAPFAYGVQNMTPLTPEDFTEEEHLALLYTVMLRWGGQMQRIPQLIYESTLSEKQLEYFNGDDHVATFNNHDQTIMTYLSSDEKLAVGVTYEQMRILAHIADEEVEASEPDMQWIFK